MALEIVTLDAPTLDPKTNLPVIRATVPLSAEAGTTDVEEFGNIDSAMCLGVTALPAAADANGHAEGIVERGCGNTDGVIVGGRDSRCASVVGNLKAGDTALHSTDSNASAQVQCKATRNIAIMTKDSDGHNMLVTVDGKNDKIQIAAFGGIIEMTKEQIMLTDPSGKSSIVMKDGTICLVGKIVLGGITATSRALSAAGANIVNPTNWLCAGPGAPLPVGAMITPAPNVYFGTGNIADAV
jgi:hypothetical protein